jgi:RNA polymerase sigma-70 factor, ECF subfamily
VLDSVADDALVRRAAGGDRHAFDEIVRRHRDRVWAVTLRICRNREEAEDALQETFIAAYRALGSFRGGAQLSTWLYRIATNKSYDVIGRRRPTAALEDVAEPAAPVDEYEQSSRRSALEAALRALPDGFREACVLCDVMGLTPTEAAEVLGIPAGTVKSRAFRGRALLARSLGTAGREPGSARAVEEETT